MDLPAWELMIRICLKSDLPGGDVKGQEAFDDLKIEALINQIGGLDHSGKIAVGVPALFGAALQVFRFAQTLPTGGYTDAKGTPSAPLQEAIEHTDQSIGKLVSALKARGLFDSTMIVISAKHGQSPMDRSKLKSVDDSLIPGLVNKVQNGLVALAYSDGDIMSIWLTDQSQTEKVGEVLSQPANQSAAGIQQVLWGDSLKLLANDPKHDSRIPDLVVMPNLGVVYYPPDDKSIAGHGGLERRRHARSPYDFHSGIEIQIGQDAGTDDSGCSDNSAGPRNSSHGLAVCLKGRNVGVAGPFRRREKLVAAIASGIERA